MGVFLPANQSETSWGDKSSILASSERRPNFSSAQSLSSVISLVDSFDAILLYAISRKLFLSSLRFKRSFQLPADAQSAKLPAFDR